MRGAPCSPPRPPMRAAGALRPTRPPCRCHAGPYRQAAAARTSHARAARPPPRRPRGLRLFGGGRHVVEKEGYSDPPLPTPARRPRGLRRVRQVLRRPHARARRRRCVLSGEYGASYGVNAEWVRSACGAHLRRAARLHATFSLRLHFACTPSSRCTHSVFTLGSLRVLAPARLHAAQRAARVDVRDGGAPRGGHQGRAAVRDVACSRRHLGRHVGWPCTGLLRARDFTCAAALTLRRHPRCHGTRDAASATRRHSGPPLTPMRVSHGGYS